MKRGYPVLKGILVQMRLFIHVFRILFTIIHSNTYLEKGLSLYVEHAHNGDADDHKSDHRVVLPRELFLEEQAAPQHARRAVGADDGR